MVKDSQKKLRESIKTKFFLILAPSIFIVSNIFLFGAYTIYQGNIGEFSVTFTSILSFFLFPALVLVLVLNAIGLLLPQGLHRRYTSILFIFGLLIWLQGNILVWKYGLLDGQGIDWSKNVWRGWVDGTLWVMLLFMACVFYRQIYKIAAFASIVLVSLQTILLVFTSFQQPEVWKTKSTVSLSAPDELFEFSSKQNVIHIILDAFQSDIFQEIINEDINYYGKILDGFTFFKETTGSFPTTRMSIPAILSGQIYKNDIPMPYFIKKTLTGRTIPNALYNNGYNVDLVFIGHSLKKYYEPGRFSTSYMLPENYGGTKQQFEQGQYAMIMDLVLFRYAPHFFKKIIYNNQSWIIQPLFFQGDISYLRPFAQIDFLRDLIGNIRINKSKPVYKFIHLMISHPPFVMNKDCGYVGKVLPFTRENVINQDRCALNSVIKVLEKLKSIGIYDNSLIIIQADHGVRIPVNNRRSDQQIGEVKFGTLIGSALPLMIIKLPHSNGALRTSSAQVMLTDIPATISSVLGLSEKFPGRSIFEIDPSQDRERRYYHYNWDESMGPGSYFTTFIEYIINGSVFKKDSWRLSAMQYPGVLKVEKIFGNNEFVPYQWGSTIKFGLLGNSQPYEIAGWSLPYEGLTWTVGKSATLIMPITTPKSSISLKATLTPLLMPGKLEKQTVDILINGKKADEWLITKPGLQEQTLNIPKSLFTNPDIVSITFNTLDATSPKQLGISNDGRVLGVAMHTIELTIMNNSSKLSGGVYEK